MNYYFDVEESAAVNTDGRVAEIMSIVLNRYIKANPQGQFTHRAYSKNGIQRSADYRYDANFNIIFPNAEDGEVVYSWGSMWSANDQELIFDINCYGPLEVLLNGSQVWRSTMFSERYSNQVNRVKMQLKRGWNNFILCAKKTRAGFGWKFGSWIGKHPYVFMMPSLDRQGQEGWLFSNPVAANSIKLPVQGQCEESTGLQWNPSTRWSVEEAALGNCARIFGVGNGKTVLAWSKITNTADEAVTVILSGEHVGHMQLLCNGVEIFSLDAAGDISGELELLPGTHDLTVLSTGYGKEWGFDLQLSGEDGDINTSSPCDLQGSDERWIYAGPFEPESLPELEMVQDMLHIHDTATGPGYWRVDAPETYVRMYNENSLFGYWNYPLGVTLYGILQAALELGSQNHMDYARDHVEFSCSSYEYSRWDHATFEGATHIHNLLSSIDSLDDCGAFGATMLETAKYFDITDCGEIATVIGDFITNKQDRFDDGAFYRRDLMHSFHNMTMWADDLYMSVPFLCRYYQMTGDQRYVDDAANQFFGFKKRLYIPEQRIMSHVYDIDREMATGVPWGRGNGWTVFSLSELLMVLPEDHKDRVELIRFYNDLCQGILALQDDEGMWHQVLTHHESYQEASCTGMFICAFSRGIRNGWLKDPEQYVDASKKGWSALSSIAIDNEGNVYGVCRGSEFSFTPDYYINDLTWNFNDTHGTGIVLLACVEISKLEQYCEINRNEYEVAK